MNTYLCRITGYDEPGEWYAIKAPSAAEAAEWYAQQRDSDSAGELFNELVDEHAVQVRRGAVQEYFSIRMEYEKTFTAFKTERRQAA